MQIRIARVLIFLFHPLLMPLLGVIFILKLEADSNFGIDLEEFVYRLIVLCTVILPLTLIISLYILRLINELSLEVKYENRIYLAFTGFCYFLAYLLLGKFLPERFFYVFPSINLTNIFLISCLFISLSVFLLSFLWEISIHMAAAGGLVGLMLFLAMVLSLDLTFYIAVAFLLSGIIGSCLLTLRNHGPLQLLGGWLLGFTIVIATFLITHLH